MKSKSRALAWKRTVVAVTVLCFAVASCIVTPQRTWALTLSEEKELGRKLLREIRKYMPVIEDEEIAAYIQSLGDRLVKQVGSTTYQYQFFVLDQGVPNAFAIPGGYIFINRGLIELMHSEGELAGVLSHELAHIQARHIHRRLEGGKMLSVAALAGVLAAVLAGMAGGGGAGAQAMAMGSIAGAKSFELKYSRENEEEADQLGFRYLCSAGYPPKDMSLAMLRLAQGQFVTSSRVPTYLSTHPDLNDRVEYLQDLVRNKEREMKGSKVCSPSASDDFYMVQAALVATYADSQLAVERLQNLSQFSKAAAEYGSARLHLRQGKVAEALPELQDAARKAASCTFVLSSLGGLYLQQGKVADAQKVLQSALVLDPSAPMVHFRLAQVLQEQGRREEALVHLQQIEEHSPIFPAIDMQLGTLLGQMNRMGLAHYHLGRYYELRQDVKNAIFHYEKAKVMLREYPDKMSEVEDSLKELNKRKKESMWEKKT